jgi:hypothetical protein
VYGKVNPLGTSEGKVMPVGIGFSIEAWGMASAASVFVRSCKDIRSCKDMRPLRYARSEVVGAHDLTVA